MDSGGLTLSRMTELRNFLSTVVARPCFSRVILAIGVLKTIQVASYKANGDRKAVVIESKCFEQLLYRKVYRIAYLNFVNSWNVRFPIAIK